MKAWVIYDQERLNVNRRFAELLLTAFAKRKIEADLIVAETIQDIPPGPAADAAVMRSVNPRLSAELESRGITVWNNSHIAEICNNKWLTYKTLEKAGIDSLPSFLVDETNIHTLEIPFPAVLKSLDGHGGTEVFLVSNRRELCERFHSLKKPAALCQEFASEPGRDMRVYVLGNTIVAAMLRTSSADFRSNFCLGGNASICTELPLEITAQVRRITQLFNFGLAGIDFIFHRGKAVFNEIEDVVGTRMLYTYTDIDIAERYVEFIVKSSNSALRRSSLR